MKSEMYQKGVKIAEKNKKHVRSGTAFQFSTRVRRPLTERREEAARTMTSEPRILERPQVNHFLIPARWQPLPDQRDADGLEAEHQERHRSDGPCKANRIKQPGKHDGKEDAAE